MPWGALGGAFELLGGALGVPWGDLGGLEAPWGVCVGGLGQA